MLIIDNLALSNELITWNGHCIEFLKLTLQVEGLMLEELTPKISALKSLYGGQFTSVYQLSWWNQNNLPQTWFCTKNDHYHIIGIHLFVWCKCSAVFWNLVSCLNWGVIADCVLLPNELGDCMFLFFGDSDCYWNSLFLEYPNQGDHTIWASLFVFEWFLTGWTFLYLTIS